MLQQLNRLPQSNDTAAAEIDREYRRQLFRRAAEAIRDEFESVTWDAFWLTTVEDVSVLDAACELKKGVGSVYAARSRVMRRLREKVGQLEVCDDS